MVFLKYLAEDLSIRKDLGGKDLRKIVFSSRVGL